MSDVWGFLPEQGYLAIIADRDHKDGSKIVIVGFEDEERAYDFCNNYESNCCDWAVVTGCLVQSGSRSDGRDTY
jgi:hypothetical protein